jgi:hypothetical protein
MLRASLGTGLIAAAFLVGAAASAGDRSTTSASAGAAREIDGCVQPVAWQRGAKPCALVEPAAGQVLSDHGLTAGEPYDAQGNPVDRHGDVIAVPEGRASQAREVFARDQGAFR